MGFGDLLSGGLTAATAGVAGYNEGKIRRQQYDDENNRRDLELQLRRQQLLQPDWQTLVDMKNDAVTFDRHAATPPNLSGHKFQQQHGEPIKWLEITAPDGKSKSYLPVGSTTDAQIAMYMARPGVRVLDEPPPDTVEMPDGSRRSVPPPATTPPRGAELPPPRTAPIPGQQPSVGLRTGADVGNPPPRTAPAPAPAQGNATVNPPQAPAQRPAQQPAQQPAQAPVQSPVRVPQQQPVRDPIFGPIAAGPVQDKAGTWKLSNKAVIDPKTKDPVYLEINSATGEERLSKFKVQSPFPGSKLIIGTDSIPRMVNNETAVPTVVPGVKVAPPGGRAATGGRGSAQAQQFAVQGRTRIGMMEQAVGSPTDPVPGDLIKYAPHVRQNVIRLAMKEWSETPAITIPFLEQWTREMDQRANLGQLTGAEQKYVRALASYAQGVMYTETGANSNQKEATQVQLRHLGSLLESGSGAADRVKAIVDMYDQRRALYGSPGDTTAKRLPTDPNHPNYSVGAAGDPAWKQQFMRSGRVVPGLLDKLWDMPPWQAQSLRIQSQMRRDGSWDRLGGEDAQLAEVRRRLIQSGFPPPYENKPDVEERKQPTQRRP